MIVILSICIRLQYYVLAGRAVVDVNIQITAGILFASCQRLCKDADVENGRQPFFYWMW